MTEEPQSTLGRECSTKTSARRSASIFPAILRGRPSSCRRCTWCCERLGYVPLQAVVEIAELLGLAPAQVQDTLSFYGFFPQDKPQGTHRIWMCRSLSCAAREGEELLDYLAKKLGIGPGQTTPDGRITLEFSECIGACDGAPAMLVDHTTHRDLSKEKIDRIVESLLKDESA